MTEINEADKVRIASDFIVHAPPGEFNEVFNDVRVLLGDDQLLTDKCVAAYTAYNCEQFMPVKLDDALHTLITPYNDLGNGRFFDPKTGKSFRYNHLRKEASDVQPYSPPPDAKAEPARVALQQAADAYLENHYLKTGVCTVFARVDDATGFPLLTLCIESHQFQPKNYWNGRWRSQWAVVLSDKQAELKGTIKVQVHYFEDGNVQLVSSKDITRQLTVSKEADVTAKEIMKIVEEEESAYQVAVQENYRTMSDTTFKALRRPLPLTRTKFDWGKTQSYRIASELKPQ